MKRVEVGGFVLAQRLGAGGMGTVWAARDPARDLDAAVKVVAGRDERSRAGLEAEIRACAELCHPNLVRLYDAGRVDADAALASDGRLREGDPWVAMELLDGELERTAVPRWAAVLRVLLDLLDGLGHAHARGFVHCDLKPENVLLAEDGRAVLTDFGVARRTDRRGAPSGPTGGTPRWMAPEQLLGESPALGPWSDLYALGLIAFWLVTGRIPFPESDPRQLRHAHALRALPAVVPAFPVPEGLPAWIRRAAHKDPGQRFRRAADAALALKALPERTVPVPEDPGSPEPRSPWSATPPPPVAQRSSPDDWRAIVREPPRPRPAELGLGLVRLRELPLVGRQDAQAALWTAFREASAGAARVVLVEGPAGAGKSALARWLATVAHASGLGTPVSAAAASGGDVVRELVANAVGEVDELSSGLADRGIPDEAAVEALLAGADPLGLLAGPGRRHAVALAALRACAEGRTLVLWVDDAPRDREVAAFVERAVAAGGALLVVLTVQTGERTPALTELAAARVAAAPLSDEAMEELIDAALPLRRDAARRVVERAEGIPLFALQLVADWIERGLLVRAGARFEVAKGSSVPIPIPLTAVWRARVDRALGAAPPDWRAVLQVAATLGRAVDAAELKPACAALGLDVPLGLLPLLVMHGLARPDRLRPRNRWTFAHGLLPESVLRGHPDRPTLERACAVALAGRPDAAERRARHLEAAGERADAVAAWLEAREHASVRDAATGFACAERAVKLAETLDARTQVRAQLALADAHRVAARYDLWTEELRRVVQRLEGEPDPALQADALSALAWALCERRETDTAKALAARAGTLLVAVEDPRARFRVLRSLSFVLMVARENALAEPLFRASIEAAPTPYQRGQQLAMLAWVVGDQDRLDEAVTLLDEARPLVTGTPAGESQWLYNHGNLLCTLGQSAEGIAEIRRAVDLRARIGSEAMNWVVVLARYQLLAGDADAAARTLDGLSPHHAGDPRVLAARVAIAARRGDGDLADLVGRLEAVDARLAGHAAGRALDDAGDRVAGADPALARRVWAQALKIALAFPGPALVARLREKLGV